MSNNTVIQQIQEYYPEITPEEIQKIDDGIKYLDLHGSSEQKERTYSMIDLLIPLKPDIETICTTLIHNFSLDCEVLKSYCNSEIKFLHESLKSLEKIQFRKELEDSENLRKVLISISKDIRVLLIHLSRVIYKIKSIDPKSSEAKNIARIGFKIYAPISEKLDLYIFKSEIEDQSFAILEPKIYEQIKNEINLETQPKENVLDQSIQKVEVILKEKDTNYKFVEGRRKNIYSIYNKMKRKNFSSVKEVYDLFAVRIVTKKNSRLLQSIRTNPQSFSPYDK